LNVHPAEAETDAPHDFKSVVSGTTIDFL
jgi:hypothetical protein